MRLYRLYIMILASLGIHLGAFGIWSQMSPPIHVSTDLRSQSFSVALKQTQTLNPPIKKQIQALKNTTKKIPEQTVAKSEFKIPETKQKTIESKSTPQQAIQHQAIAAEQQPNLSQQRFALLNNDMLKELHSEFQARFKYPMLARKRGWQGKVVLALNINLQGKIANIAVKHSSGYKVLDYNAVKTFEAIGMVSPSLHDRIKQTRSFNIPIVYQLNGG